MSINTNYTNSPERVSDQDRSEENLPQEDKKTNTLFSTHLENRAKLKVDDLLKPKKLIREKPSRRINQLVKQTTLESSFVTRSRSFARNGNTPGQQFNNLVNALNLPVGPLPVLPLPQPPAPPVVAQPAPNPNNNTTNTDNTDNN